MKHTKTGKTKMKRAPDATTVDQLIIKYLQETNCVTKSVYRDIIKTRLVNGETIEGSVIPDFLRPFI